MNVSPGMEHTMPPPPPHQHYLDVQTKIFGVKNKGIKLQATEVIQLEDRQENV